MHRQLVDIKTTLGFIHFLKVVSWILYEQWWHPTTEFGSLFVIAVKKICNDSNYCNFINWRERLPCFPVTSHKCDLCLYSSITCSQMLTHWGRVMHICVGKLKIIGSDNGLAPSWRQAILWTNAGLLSIRTLRTYFSEILIKIQQFSLKKMYLKMSSAKQHLCCLGPNVLKVINTCIRLSDMKF